MTNTIFIYRAKRSRNKLKYVPYKKHYNSLYDQIDIDTILEKIAGEQMSSVMCQGNLTSEFVSNALGFDEIEDYEDADDGEIITVDENSKGVDILVLWTDKKPTTSGNIIQSVRGIAGLHIRKDNRKNKYAELSIICNASSSKMKTRYANLKKKGKEILELLDQLAKDKKCKYITLKALDNVITYYHKFGYKLVNYPFDEEKTSTTDYVKRLNQINSTIDKLERKHSTKTHKKRDDLHELEMLDKEKYLIMNKFQRYLVGLYNVNDRANFNYSETPDTEDETGDDFVEDLSDNGYRMYKSLVKKTPNAGKKTRKNNKTKTRKKTRSKKGGIVSKIEWIVENTQHNIDRFRNSNLPDNGVGLMNLIREMETPPEQGGMVDGFFIIEWNAHDEPHHMFNRYHPAFDDRDLNVILAENPTLHIPHFVGGPRDPVENIDDIIGSDGDFSDNDDDY